MVALSVLDALAPLDLVESALSQDQRGFLTLYGDTLLLLVEVGDPEVAAGLGATAVRGAGGTPAKPVASSIEFHTQVQSASAVRAAAARLPAKQLGSGAHFALPLRKRPGAEAAYRERISVGRARNKDIVLRHASVSKFHGWFEVDELGSFHFTDAGSSNGTRVNGEALPARKRTALEPEDLIRFGGVEAALWAPRALWEAIRSFAQGRT